MIDQLQNTGVETLTLKTGSPQFQYRMNFNHPVKELVWVFQRSINAPQGGNLASNDWFNFSTADPGLTEGDGFTGDIMSTRRQACNILLNGHDRFFPRPATYFRLVQPYQHHTRIPSKHIYVYAFGLRPEEHQPSGTVNMSRIDNAQLVYQLSDNSYCESNGSSAWTTTKFGNDSNGTLTVFATNLTLGSVIAKTIASF